MNWTTKYHQREEFTDWFATEQEFIDAMFILIIMENYGVWLTQGSLYRSFNY